MIQVTGEYFVKEMGLDWKAFAMTNLQLKENCGVKIQTKAETEASLEKMKKDSKKVKESKKCQN